MCAVRVTRPRPATQVVFIHLPKVGGMSLQAAIAAGLPPGRVRRIGDDAERASFLAQSAEELAGYGFIGGHVSLAEAQPRARQDARFVALLRDPVARLLSAFNYMATWKDHPLHAEFRDLGFADFVERSGARLAGEACRQLTGMATAAAAIPILEARYAMVATTPHIAVLGRAVSGWLGLPPPVMGRENVTQGQGRITLDSATCAALLEVTQEDRALYAHVAAYHGGVLQRAA
jgi:hypothetical protein